MDLWVYIQFMKLLALFTILCLSLSALAGDWEDYISYKESLVSHHDHLPYRLTHGHRTEKSVLLIHGAYSSPLHFRGMAQSFFDAGYNVVTILLPGHWEKNKRSLDLTDYSQWIEETDAGFKMAQELGEKVILAGHSLGGLLALEQAHKRPSKVIAGLVLLAPAVKLWSAIVVASKAGIAMGLSGNSFTFKKPDGHRVPYFATRTGIEIHELSNQIPLHPLETPLYLGYSWKDSLVNVHYLRSWFNQYSGPRKARSFTVWSGVNHGSLPTSPTDVATYGNGHNPHLSNMMTEAIDFLEKQK